MKYHRLQKILTLALPIIGGMTSQNILNLVDTAMVGRISAAALAAVGFCSFINFAAFALITGLSAGVQATAARRFGEGQLNKAALPLNAGLLLSIIIGLPITLALFFSTPWLLRQLLTSPEVIAEGIPYLQIRSLSIIAIGINFSFRGYWNATHRSKYYLYTIVLMHIANIGISYVLIFGKAGFPALGTSGAAIGTTSCIFLGSFIYIYMATKSARREGFCTKLPKIKEVKALLSLSTPTSIQQFLFAAGMATLFWMISQLGTAELAVANVLINITLVALLPAIGLGLASASFVGQALGKNNPEDARQWAWDVVKVGSLIFSVLGLLMLLTPHVLLQAFLQDPELIALAKLPLQMVGLSILIDGIGTILMQSLLGAGDGRTVMWVATGMQWLLFLPLAWLLGPILGLGLLTVWLAFISYRCLQSAVFITIWQHGKWQKIHV